MGSYTAWHNMLELKYSLDVTTRYAKLDYLEHESIFTQQYYAPVANLINNLRA